MAARHGVSPLISFMLLLGVVLSLATGAYMFITDQQDRVNDAMYGARLETANITCDVNTVDWWVENTGKKDIQAIEGRLTVTHNGSTINQLSEPQFALTHDFTEAGGIDKIALTPSQPLESGSDYVFTLTAGDQQVIDRCTAGIDWYNVNWDYRRKVNIAGSMDANGWTTVQLNTSTLIKEGKLQPRCQDIRVTINGNVVNHSLPDANNCSTTPQTDITFKAPNPATASQTTYLYYGNLNTAVKNTTRNSAPASTPVSPLGPEERINLPG